MEVSAFDAYQTFLALKAHFAPGKYDYHTYNGKVAASEDSFERRKDFYTFVGIARKWKGETRDFMLANYLQNQKVWPRALTSADAENIYKEWKKRQQSFLYMTKEDFVKIIDHMALEEYRFDNIFQVHDGQHPVLLRLYYQNKIALETLMAMDYVLNFIPRWNTQIEDDVIWGETSRLIANYTPFLVAHIPTLRETMKQTFVGDNHVKPRTESICSHA
jgi:hypothetical protein|tara:strand:+ start:9604 stop:10257 length:654 start_codon:yes stop_codon:yes gene_type:complete